MPSLIIHLFYLLIASAICSLIEAALLSLPFIRARILHQQNKPGSKDLLYIKENITITIAMIVIVNNAINIIGSIYIGQEVVQRFGDEWLGLASTILTIVLIVFTEVIPKTIGERLKIPVSLFIAKPVRWMLVIFRPVVEVLVNCAKIFAPDTSAPKVTEEEIKIMLSLGRDAGTVETDEEALINRVFKLNDVRAFQIMRPLDEVLRLPADQTFGELKDQIIDSKYTRIPVYDKSPLTIVGVVRQRTLLSEMAKGNCASKVREFMSPPIVINGMVPADRLLEKFQHSHQHLFIVEDAKHKHIGIVTMEDVLEELFGEIFDEKDAAKNKPKEGA